MRQNRVKQIMRQGQLALGTYVSLADPQVVEIIGVAGFDAAFIDMEHTDFDLPLVAEMIRAVDAVRYPPLGQRGAAGGTRAARFGAVPWEEHVQQSNDEILLSVMCEDERGISDMEQIAALPGVDLVAIGPTDFSEYMGIRDPSDPRLRHKLNELAEVVKYIGKAKLQFPTGHQALPLTAQELVELGAGYTHVAPSPPAILLRDMRDRVRDIHQAIGR